MRACPYCSFYLADHDSICPKCQNKGLTPPTQPQQWPKPPLSPSASPAPTPLAPAPSRPNFSGVGIGIAIGAFALASVVYFSPGTSAPTPTPAAMPVVAPVVAPVVRPTGMAPMIPTQIPVAPTPTPIVQRQPVPREESTQQSTEEQLRGISFAAYGHSSFNAIRRASTPQEAARLALNYYNMEQQASEAANEATTQREVLMWNSASGLFGALAEAADNQRDYLNGQMIPGLLSSYEATSEKLITMHAQMADNLK